MIFVFRWRPHTDTYHIRFLPVNLSLCACRQSHQYNSFFQDTVTRLHQAALFLINALLVWNGMEYSFFHTRLEV